MATHYDTLGVARSASSVELRRAYRDLARQLHPDRHAGAGDDQQVLVSNRMAEINAAWAVLSDARARELYDLELRLGDARAERDAPARTAAGPARTAGSPHASGTGRPSGADLVDVAPAYGPVAAIFRAAPWMVVVVVLAGIFVFTAFAASRANSGDGSGGASPPTIAVRLEPGNCVRIVSATALERVDCRSGNDGQVLALVPLGRPCPTGTQASYLPDDEKYACIRLQ